MRIRPLPPRHLSLALLIIGFMTPAADAQELRHFIHETISFNGGGSCDLTYTLTVPPSPLGDLYREFLDVPTGDYTSRPIPDTVTSVAPAPTYGPDVVQGSESFNWPSLDVPVRSQILKGFIDLHRYHYGIIIEESDVVTATTSGINGDVLVQITVQDAQAQETGSKVLLGPQDLEESFARMAFVLIEMSYVQLLLLSDPGYDAFKSEWVTDLHFPVADHITNQPDLFDREWEQQLGASDGEHFLKAQLSIVSPHQLMLHEETRIGETAVTRSPEQLYDEGFHCYKAFLVERDATTVSQPPGSPPRLVGTFADSLSWSYDLVNASHTLDLASGTQLVTAEATLSYQAGVGIGTRWNLKLDRTRNFFETYLEVFASIDGQITLALADCWEYSTAVPALSAESPTMRFVIATIPVTAKLILETNANIALCFAEDHSINYCICASGSIRVGAKWVRGRGWRPIREVEFETGLGEDCVSGCTVNWGNLALASELTLPVRLTLELYGLGGPFGEVVPYASLLHNPDQLNIADVEDALVCDDSSACPANLPQGDEVCIETLRVGMRAFFGVDLPGFLEPFGIHDYYWPQDWDFVLWQQGYECVVAPPPQVWDVALVDLQVPNNIMIKEREAFALTATNIGQGGTVAEVQLKLSGWDGPSSDEILLFEAFSDPDDPFVLDEGEVVTWTHNWDTDQTWPDAQSPLPACQNQIHFTAEAVLLNQQDVDGSNNELSAARDWHVRETLVSDISVTPSQVNRGEDFVIDVEVSNHPRGLPVEDVIVRAYYSDNPQGHPNITISDLWCENSRAIFSLSPGDCQGTLPGSETVTFIWDTNGVDSGTSGLDYWVSSIIPFASEEYDPDNNSEVDDQSVTVNPPLPNSPPFEPSNPQPPDGATGVPIDGFLEWEGGDPDGVAVYDVYLSPHNPPILAAVGVEETVFDASGLETGTTYFWSIVAIDDLESVQPGPVWSFTTGFPPFIRGDCNADGTVNIADGIWILNDIFGDGPEGPCAGACDVNGDGGLDVADPVFLFMYSLVGGPPPPPPFPGCGAGGPEEACGEHVPCGP